jgi:hypothetical protein
MDRNFNEPKELNLEDYQEYFVLDDRTGDLFIRTDLKKHMKTLKGDKIWLLLKIMSFNGGDEEEHQHDIDMFEYGKGIAYRTRKAFDNMRDALMQALIERDGAKCKHCRSTNDLTVDHIVAVVKGGKNLISNMQILCRSCNSRKGAR